MTFAYDELNVDRIRRELAKRFLFNENKIPADFSTHPGFVDVEGFTVKVLSTADAKRLKPNARLAYRIFVWDTHCSKWLPAGKYEQHKRLVHK